MADKDNFRLQQPQDLASIIQSVKDLGNPEIMRKIKPKEFTAEDAMDLNTVTSLIGHLKPSDMEKYFADMLESKIRDASGELVPVYHGGESLAEGLPTKGTGIYSEGTYFTGIPERTQMYAEKANAGAVYPMYAAIKNPIYVDEFRRRFGYANPNTSKHIRDTLVNEGYDGVLSMLGDRIWEGVAFHPEKQLKSSVSAITPKMRTDKLVEDVKKFNKYD